MVKKKTNGAVPISFAPRSQLEAEAKLTIFNPITNDIFEYELMGFGEDPLSEGHINLHCFARK